MKVLITGSSGFLAKMFIEVLKSKRIDYVTYDRAQPQLIDKDVTAVVHFGGLTPHSRVVGRAPTAADYMKANVEGTRVLLEALGKRQGLTRFVHIGSASEYGLGPKPFTEDSRATPEQAYGVSKRAQSALVEAWARETGIATVNLRLFNLTGISSRSSAPGLTSARPHLFSFLMQEFKKKPPVRIDVQNEQDVRDFVSPEDAIDAIYRALTMPLRSTYELINVSSGRGVTVAEVVALFGSLLDTPYELRNTRKTVERSVGVATKARRLLGWKAKTSCEEAIRQYVGRRSRLIIVGAGVGGSMVLEEMKKEDRDDVVVVGMVDDDLRKVGKKVQGVPVLGTIDELPRLVQEKKATQVLVSTPSQSSQVTARVAELLPPGFPIKVLPSVSSVILAKFDLSYVRDIDLSDLVGRPLVKANQTLIGKHARGKSFLVTGGAGSIGSELVRQLADSGAREVVVYDSWEEGVYSILEEMHARKGVRRVIGRIGNVRDKARLAEVFDEFKFDVVIHAAAYKHVPLMEESPEEAKKTNVQGTKNVLEASGAHKVSDFVLISTDKAVRPSSVMGQSKRDAELLVKRFAASYPKQRYCAVRFGNVLNSSGSAVPKFLKQIQARTAVTITHKDMTRYFMSIPEAVSLVLTSWIVGKSGQILLLDMGEPIRILDLAEKLIRIHGLRPYADIPITLTGVRPGEKIHEELAYDPAKLKPSPAKRIFIAEEL